MKKLLYGTTALIAVGLMAGTAVAAEKKKVEKIKLGLGGYWRAAIHLGDSDNDAPGGTAAAVDNRSHGLAQESEIYFSGKTTLDNGVKFGVTVQLEGETSADQMDNSYIWTAGSFGRLEFGETWGPSLLMSYGSVGDQIDGHSDFASNFAIGTGRPNGQFINTFGGGAALLATPDQKINYFTPRMAGFQLGIGYIPENKAGNMDGSGLDSKLGGTIGNELLDIGINYTGKFGDASLAGFGSYYTSDTEKSSAAALAAKDVDGYSLGGQIGISGFRVGGRYTKTNDIAGTGAGLAVPVAGAVAPAGLDRTGWRIGVDYGFGPWKVGVAHYNMEQEIAGAAAGTKSARDDEIELSTISASYALGPGIKMFGGLMFFDFQDSTNAAGLAPGNEGDNTIGVIGTKLSF